MFFIALLSPTSRIVTISNLTPLLYDQLHHEHDGTLSYPCSTITIPYSTFVTNMVSFHPVCLSIFVSREWIEGFYLPVANAYLLDDFRTTAFSQLVTVELFEEEDIQLQVEVMVELVRATAYVQITSLLQHVQMMYHSNTLVSAFGTNAVVQIGSGSVSISSTYQVNPNDTYSLGSNGLSCTEKIMVTPAVFYAQPLDTSVIDHTYWPVYYDVNNVNSIVSASVDGFFGGCFPLDAVLASTLDCLYNVQCLEILFNYFPALNQSKVKLIDLHLSSSRRNISVNNLVSDLFIEQWSTKINYMNYFNQCAPLVPRTQTEYLGHQITNGEIRPSPHNVNGLLNTQVPQTADEACKFIKAADYYRKFIPNFSQIAEPLRKLVPTTRTQQKKRQKTKITLDDDEIKAFEGLKRFLTSDLVLRLPNNRFPFKVQTDASDEGIGAVLLQIYPEGDRPIANLSKKFTQAQRKWSPMEQECYAFICALDKWHNYLSGIKFKWETDHKALTQLNQKARINKRCER
ncbi:unnamed protein product [Adineta steineri]|uniref:Reverse transcriptase/retrotransposon-derived protein RNase H-like domain-containing protein n=1 Tax=Adineta steineri TaxID=433720 RepID=A0A814CRL1_9BILA|nr:unnamed protein product [Adineta steineri]